MALSESLNKQYSMAKLGIARNIKLNIDYAFYESDLVKVVDALRLKAYSDNFIIKTIYFFDSREP